MGNEAMTHQRNALGSGNSLNTGSSRRQFLRGLGIAASLAATGIPFQVQAAEDGRLLRLTGTVGDPDPHRATDIPGSILMFNLYDFLVRPAQGGQILPALAESWSTSEDGRAYTFALRNDVVFHDGAKLTAADVVFSLNRIKTMKRGFSALFDFVESVESSGDYEVVFRLREPYSPFLSSLTRLAIVNSALIRANLADGQYGDMKDYGQAFLGQADAGSGPYTLAQHNPQQETVLNLYPSYHLKLAEDVPSEVRTLYSIDPATVRTIASRGELELTRVSLPPEILASLARLDGVKLGQDRGTDMMQFKLNMMKAPTDDLEFRRAVSLGFNYEALYSLLDIAGVSSGIPARGPIPQGAMGYSQDVPIMKRDLDGAKAALARSKYAGDGAPPLTVLWASEFAQVQKYALLFQSSMAEVGIKVELSPAPWAQYQKMITTAETTPNVCMLYVGLTTPDIDSLFWPTYHSSAAGTYNSMQWLQSPEIDEALERGREILDPTARTKHYQELAKKISDLYPAIFAYDRINVVAMNKRLKAPALEDLNQSIPVWGGNYQFRMMDISRA